MQATEEAVLAKLFDCVAPIVIYFYADLQYKSEALAGWRSARRIKASVWKKFGCEPSPRASWKYDGDLIKQWAFDTYNSLFIHIIEQYDLDWKYDYWGARELVKNGKSVGIAGSEYGAFPWYSYYDGLIARLDEL